MSKNLTEGSIVKSLLTLAVPIIFASLLQTAYQLVDTFWVGRLGANAVAAVSLSFPIFFLLISLGGGFSIAGTILVAQYKGEKNQRKIDQISSQTLMITLFLSLLLSALGYFLATPLITLMGADSVILPQALSYIKTIFLGLTFLFIFSMFQSLMRGIGNVKTPLYIVFGTVILNLILDPLFIFGYSIVPAMGVKGAAIATILTQSIAAIIGLSLLFKEKYGINIKIKYLKPDFKIFKKIFFLGLPASLGQTTSAFGITLITFLVASFSTTAIASYGIGGRILSFIIIPTIGLSMATSTLVGQNIGAKKIDRAEKIVKISTMIGFVTLTLVGLIIFIFAKQLTTFFIPTDTAVIAGSTLFLKIMSLTFGFLAIQQIISGAFRGSGNTLISMIIAIVSLLVLRFPLAYIFSKHTSLLETGIWWAFPISNILTAIIAVLWFAKGSWKNKKIIEEIKLEVEDETIIEEGIL